MDKLAVVAAAHLEAAAVEQQYQDREIAEVRDHKVWPVVVADLVIQEVQQ
jgi:hypothetical protein